jgi:Ca2+-binding RTX toxin-like protein
MTVVTAGSAGVDMSSIDLTLVLSGAVTSQTSNSYVLNLGEGDVVTFTGSNFTYDASGNLTGGTVTGLSDAYNGASSFDASGFSVPAATLAGWAMNGQGSAGLQTILAGDDTLSAPNATPNALYGYDGNDSISGGSAADTLDGGAGDNTVLGNAGADVITVSGSSGSNYLRGGDGDDQIFGGTGYNNVNGNTGADTIVGQSTVGDWLLGGQGGDSITAAASAAHNIINGNMGDDTLHGGSGGDSLRGGQGSDLIVGGSGADWISGDLGNNTETGGAGADTFHAGAGVDSISDFSITDGDRIQLDHGVTHTDAQVGADVHLTLSNGGEVVLTNVQLSSLANSNWIITT